MAITTRKLTRVFMYSGRRLPDLSPNDSPDAVRSMYAAAGYADLNNAAVEGPKQVGDELHYSFTRVVRDKGWA